MLVNVHQWFLMTSRKITVFKPTLQATNKFFISDRPDTRGKWHLARNPDRSWWHRHTSLKLFWPQHMSRRTGFLDSDGRMVHSTTGLFLTHMSFLIRWEDLSWPSWLHRVVELLSITCIRTFFTSNDMDFRIPNYRIPRNSYWAR